MGGRRSYDGDPPDRCYQYFAERPHDDSGETVDIVDAEHEEYGEVTPTDIPVPDGETEQSDTDGQSTWEAWGWSP